MIYGISGYASSGKDTIGAFLVKEFGFKRVAFADKMKEFAYHANPIIDVRQDPDAPRAPIQDSWEATRLATAVDQFGWDGVKQRFPEAREFLQRLGTEAGRHTFGSDFWTRQALEGAHPAGHYVVTDVRFPDEANFIKAVGGKVWRVIRTDTTAVNAHVSESAMDGYEDYDRTILNDGTIEDLYTKVGAVVDSTFSRVPNA